MEAREFKSLFAEVAKAHDFLAASGGWYRELPVALFVLELQKSNFGNYYELNLKLFLDRTVPKDPKVFRRLIKSQSGDVFRRQPEEFRAVFDLDSTLDTPRRRAALELMFGALVERIATAATDSAGILRLREQGVLYLQPAIEERLRASSSAPQQREGQPPI